LFKIIIIDPDLCKGCNLCVEFCPVGVYVKSDKTNKNGIHVPEPLHEDKCIQCGLCTFLCPDQAITIDL